MPFVRWYWRIVRPKTFGVKIFILNPHNQDEVLLVRHSYGNRKKWNLPGGGYRPKRETPIQASIREVREELRLELLNTKIIGEYSSDLEGKQDTVTILLSSISERDEVVPRDEVAEVTWENTKDLFLQEDVSRVVKEGLKFLIL